MRHTAGDGFTLIETLVSLALFGILMVGAFTLYATNQDAFRKGQRHAEAQQNARIAVEAAAREIRMAGFDRSGVLSTLTPATAIQAAEEDAITFVADLTGDGVLDRVTYRLEDGQLLREISSWNGHDFPAPTTGEVAEGVDLLTFEYFDDGTPSNHSIRAPVTTGLADIRRVTISIVAGDSIVGRRETFPLVVDVRLRN